jgi:membrane protein implicated in regulation of membrane protease activity
VDGGVGLAVWLVIALALVGVELATLAFVALYLAIGAVGAGIAAVSGAGPPLQVLVFAVVAVASLVLTRKPLMRALRKTPAVVSNAPTVLGKRAVVTVAVEPGPGQRGQVRVGTEYWSARSEDENAIDEGTTVEVAGIDGVALVIRPVANS